MSAGVALAALTGMPVRLSSAPPPGAGATSTRSRHAPPFRGSSMRDCPTIDGSSIPLIIHRIGVSSCLERQSCNYHKCHRCVYRGQAANWEPQGSPDDLPRGLAPRTAERAVPSKLVAVPRPAANKHTAAKEASKPSSQREQQGEHKTATKTAARPRN